MVQVAALLQAAATAVVLFSSTTAGELEATQPPANRLGEVNKLINSVTGSVIKRPLQCWRTLRGPPPVKPNSKQLYWALMDFAVVLMALAWAVMPVMLLMSLLTGGGPLKVRQH